MRAIWPWALAGAAAAAMALAAGELAAALLGGGSPIAAIGTLVIDLQPPGGKDLMVALFGENDKLALEIATGIGALLVGALLGVVARRSQQLAIGGFVAFAGVALLAIARDPLVGPGVAVIVVAPALVAAVLVLRGLLPARPTPSPGSPAPEPSAAAGLPVRDRTPDSRVGAPVARRGFLLLAGTALALGATLALVGRFISARVPPVVRGPLSLAVRETVPTPGPGADFDLAGLTPIITPNEDFYRIDTRLTLPRIDPATWRMRIHGMVERELELSYDELVAMPMVERYVTLACVSNQVGGHLVGHARWTGTPLVGLLERAGVSSAASQLVGRSVDGWTCGFPTAHLAGAGRDALVAVAMNGEALPVEHGYPARLVVPGLYGYVSATKWLGDIELTTLEAFDAYWVPLGWAKEAPILTQSRIDLPRQGARVEAGTIEVAGVAWAPTRGIERVEVQLDDQPWQPAELSVALSAASWVQWRTIVQAAAGSHVLRVKATDGTGDTQTADRTPPAPDGARGYHMRMLNVG